MGDVMEKYMKRLNMIFFVIVIISVFSTINVYAEEYTCTGVFTDGLINDVNQYVFKPIKWLTPIALLVLTSIDFAGVVLSGKKEGMDKAKNNFLKRTAAAFIIFFAPDILNLIANLVNKQSIASCMESFGLTK